MKKLISLTAGRGLFLFLLMTSIAFIAESQVKYYTKDDLNLLVSGTSTLHDWDMKSAKGTCEAFFTFTKEGRIKGLTDLSLVTPATGLHSGHEGMDMNTYKALKADKFPHISFRLISAMVGDDGNIKCRGKLTIAGVTHTTDLEAVYKINGDKSVSISGTKKIDLLDFNMEIPTFMGGNFKTGKDIVLKFDLTLRK
jgi:hypothetical protein